MFFYFKLYKSIINVRYGLKIIYLKKFFYVYLEIYFLLKKLDCLKKIVKKLNEYIKLYKEDWSFKCVIFIESIKDKESIFLNI